MMTKVVLFTAVFLQLVWLPHVFSQGPIVVDVSATEGGTMVATCPAGTSIVQVLYASYGTPSGRVLSPLCHALSSVQIVDRECTGRSSCSVRASNSVFGDPCFGILKRLNAGFECVANSDFSSFSGEDNEGGSVSISCPAGEEVVNIDPSSYYGQLGQNCRAANSVSVLQNRCLHRSSCNVAASNAVFGDPCVGIRKRLRIVLTCAAVPDRKIVITSSTEGNQVQFNSCPAGTAVVSVPFASYGTPLLGSSSLPTLQYSSCHASSTSLQVANSNCLGRSQCSVFDAINTVFGDPCFGTRKRFVGAALCL